MGTHAIVKVFNDKNEELVRLYSHWDGDERGVGLKLRDFLAKRIETNGIRAGELHVFNGMDCLAAMIVAHFKGDTIGGYYLQPTSRPVDHFVPYVYEVRTAGSGNEPILKAIEAAYTTYESGEPVQVPDRTMYEGSVSGWDLEGRGA